MAYAKRSKKLLLTSTMFVILALTLVVTTYAAIIATYNGGSVIIGVATGTIYYSADGSTNWATSLTQNTTTWYTRFNPADGSYSGPVQMTWQLQNQTAPNTWADVGTAQTTNTVLNGTSTEYVYVTSNGDQSGNYDWGTIATAQGTYRIKLTINSVS